MIRSIPPVVFAFVALLVPRVSAVDGEFRRALLMNSSGDRSNLAKIEKLKKTLESKGFAVTYLPNANRDGYPAYQRFVRGLPAKGKSIIYYCGDIDIVRDEKTRRDSYRYQLGKFAYIPPDGFPGHNQRTVTDTQVVAEPKIPDRYIDGRTVRVFEPVSAAQLVVLDIQTFRQPEKPESTYEKRFNGGRFLTLKPEQAERINVYLGNEENAGAVLAEKLASAIASGKEPKTDLSGGSLALGSEDFAFTLEGKAAGVISPPDRLVAGGKVGGQWLDPHGICFLWCPPGKFTMGCPDFADTQPKEVTISKGFWMSKYEITKSEGLLFGLSSKGGSSNTPVKIWTRNRLVRNVGNQNLYMEARGRSQGNWSYDIPTEAEWEYVCRAGDKEHAPAPFEKLVEHANFADSTLYGVEGTHGEEEHLYAYRGASDGVGLEAAEVGSYKPNAWGFQDMLGNVSEWCADLYKAELDGGADPLDQYLESDRKIHARVGVYRGGAWCTRPDFLNYAYRGFSVPRSSTFLGVRLVLRPGERKAKTVAEILAKKKQTAGASN